MIMIICGDTCTGVYNAMNTSRGLQTIMAEDAFGENRDSSKAAYQNNIYTLNIASDQHRVLKSVQCSWHMLVFTQTKNCNKNPTVINK